ncbi:VTT domain-containing protein [Patescibacteria group bacterium]|nr:VTT domain-containing protein [Patescibacteria group bacterium]
MIRTGGYVGIAFLIFAESGLLFGIFLPGDSLLFAAGLLSSNGTLAILPLTLFVAAAAIIGDSVGYWFGANVGVNFFSRKDSFFFKREYLRRTERFYENYGGRAVILARFVPIVRTIAPILAGIGSMTYKKFLFFNIIGGCLWGAGMVLLGYTLGSLLPNSEHYVLPLSLVIIIVSFFPILFNIIRGKRAI